MKNESRKLTFSEDFIAGVYNYSVLTSIVAIFLVSVFSVIEPLWRRLSNKEKVELFSTPKFSCLSP